MHPSSFHDLHVAGLAEMRSVEAKMADKLGALAEAATGPCLCRLIRAHQNTTTLHRDRLGALLASHDTRPDAHFDGSMSAMIAEAGKRADMVDDGALRDAGLVDSPLDEERKTDGRLSEIAEETVNPSAA